MSSNNEKLEKLFNLTQECCSHLSALGKNGLAAKLLLALNEARRSCITIPTPTATTSAPSRPLIDIATGKWDNAIKDAEDEIHLLTQKVARLQQAVRIFKANKRDGVPWPGQQQKSPQEGANEVTR